ncbi:MAG: thymidine phosphorylase [Eubacteriaceae bacterium]|nr:thymidine phosphorylase [Eubacteriaceae bacterium]
MDILDIIEKKKKGQKLSSEEISFFAAGYAKGDIPDYQASALLMAICINGMHSDETAALTKAIVESGETLDLSGLPGIKVDKHSNGGVGDKASLVVVPMLASLGYTVIKASGRGLGHTGGTLDKLESIGGLVVGMDMDRLMSIAERTNALICEQSPMITPADKKLYALRDVTATVDSPSLIAASIMSKKIACGADAIVLDVKIGSGSFMKTLEDGQALAREMISIGTSTGKKVSAVLTDMGQPLGYAVGNALEVIEAANTLKGSGPGDLLEVSIELASTLMASVGEDKAAAVEKLIGSINSGMAYSKFVQIILAQGADEVYADNINLILEPRESVVLKAREGGYVYITDCEAIGKASLECGAGRKQLGDTIDSSAGIMMHVKNGDLVSAGDPVATLYSSSSDKLEIALGLLDGAFGYCQAKPDAVETILGTLS